MDDVVASHDGLINFEEETTPADSARLADLLYEYNVKQTGLTDGRRFGLYLRDDDDQIVGGVDGWTWGGTCFIATLFVPEAHRRAGLGTRLMKRVEDEAQRRGCRRMMVRTDDYQAPDFYWKLGYELVADVVYVAHHHELTFLKHLQPLSGQ